MSHDLLMSHTERCGPLQALYDISKRRELHGRFCVCDLFERDANHYLQVEFMAYTLGRAEPAVKSLSQCVYVVVLDSKCYARS
jgi:hypothetical protein